MGWMGEGHGRRRRTAAFASSVAADDGLHRSPLPGVECGRSNSATAFLHRDGGGAGPAPRRVATACLDFDPAKKPLAPPGLGGDEIPASSPKRPNWQRALGV